MGVFSLLQQIYPHNKVEQQSAEIINESAGKRRLKAMLRWERRKNNLEVIKYTWTRHRALFFWKEWRSESVMLISNVTLNLFKDLHALCKVILLHSRVSR